MEAKVFMTQKGNFGANIIIDGVAKCQIVKKSDGSYKIYGMPSTSNFVENDEVGKELLEQYNLIVQNNIKEKLEREAEAEEFIKGLISEIDEPSDIEMFIYKAFGDVLSNYNARINPSDTNPHLVFEIDNKEVIDLIERACNDKGFDYKCVTITTRPNQRNAYYNTCFSYDDFIETETLYADSSFNFLTKEDKEESLMENIKSFDSYDDLKQAMSDVENFEDGYYTDCGNFALKPIIHGKYFGHEYDGTVTQFGIAITR